MLAVFLLAPAVHADLLAIECTDSSGNRIEEGWVGQWASYGEPGLSPGKQGISGSNGGTSRRMAQAFDPSTQSELFFRVTFRRTGGGRGDEPDFVGAYLEVKRHDTSRITLGISSYESFMIGIAENMKPFGSYTEGEAVTLIGRLQSDGSGSGILDAWVWSADQDLPSAAPDSPMASVQGPLPVAPATILRLACGKKAALNTEFLDVRVGTSWEDVTSSKSSRDAQQ